MVYEVLVTLEFGGGIAAHVLVPVAGHGAVENVNREVQDAVLGILVLEDYLVYGAFGKGLVEVPGRCEVVGVEVALSNHEEVREGKEAYRNCRNPLSAKTGKFLCVSRLPLGKICPQKRRGAEGDEDEGHTGILAEQHYAVLDKGVYKDVLHAVVGRAAERAEDSGGQPCQKAEAAGKAESPPEGLHELLLGVLLFGYAVQCKEAKHRQGYLQHHQRHRDRPELVVKRQILETEFSKRHEMVSHGHQDGDDGCRQQPPFFPAPIEPQAQDEKEHGYGAHVHGPGGEWLRPPVKGQGLGGFPYVLLAVLLKEFYGFRFVGVHSTGRCSAVEIRYHKVGKFFPAVAPGGGVVKVQAVCVGALLG